MTTMGMAPTNSIEIDYLTTQPQQDTTQGYAHIQTTSVDAVTVKKPSGSSGIYALLDVHFPLCNSYVTRLI